MDTGATSTKTRARLNTTAAERENFERCGYQDPRRCGQLTFATRENQAVKVAELLADEGDPHQTDQHGWSPWAYALASGDSPRLDAFIEAGVDVRGKYRFPLYNIPGQAIAPLLFAISHGNADAIRTLTARGANPHEPGPFGYPVANFAAYYGNISALKALKESGIDLLSAVPLAQAHDGETFLMHAAQGGRAEAVEYLQSLGARADQRDPRGMNASDHAKAYGHFWLATKLWAAGVL